MPQNLPSGNQRNSLRHILERQQLRYDPPYVVSSNDDDPFVLPPMPETWPLMDRRDDFLRWCFPRGKPDLTERDIRRLCKRWAAGIAQMPAGVARDQARQSYEELRPVLLGTSPQGKPPYIRNLEDWRALILPLIEELDRPSDPVTRARLAPYLQKYLPRQSSKQVFRDDESVEKFISRQGKRFGCSLDDLVQEVRFRRKK
jgi:hypothetical protein